MDTEGGASATESASERESRKRKTGTSAEETVQAKAATDGSEHQRGSEAKRRRKDEPKIDDDEAPKDPMDGKEAQQQVTESPWSSRGSGNGVNGSGPNRASGSLDRSLAGKRFFPSPSGRVLIIRISGKQASRTYSCSRRSIQPRTSCHRSTSTRCGNWAATCWKPSSSIRAARMWSWPNPCAPRNPLPPAPLAFGTRASCFPSDSHHFCSRHTRLCVCVCVCGASCRAVPCAV